MVYISPDLKAAEIAKIGFWSNFSMVSLSYCTDVVGHASSSHRCAPDKMYRLIMMPEEMKRLSRSAQAKLMGDKVKEVQAFLRFWKLNTIWSTDSNEHFDMIKNLVSQHMFIAYAAEFIVKRYAWA